MSHHFSSVSDRLDITSSARQKTPCIFIRKEKYLTKFSSESQESLTQLKQPHYAQSQMLPLLHSPVETWPVRVSSQQKRRRGLCSWWAHMVGLCGSFIQGSNLEAKESNEMVSQRGSCMIQKHQIWSWNFSWHWWYNAFMLWCVNRTRLTKAQVRLSIQKKRTSFTKRRAWKPITLPFPKATCQSESLSSIPGLMHMTWQGTGPLLNSVVTNWETKHYTNLFATSSS